MFFRLQQDDSKRLTAATPQAQSVPTARYRVAPLI
jgi:hypothetical protein